MQSFRVDNTDKTMICHVTEACTVIIEQERDEISGLWVISDRLAALKS